MQNEINLHRREDADIYWNKQAAAKLAGRTIKRARYLSKAEARGMGWHARSVVLELDNDAVVIVQSDDEGNDAGALLVLGKNSETILPVI
jgi:hypothetical protein